MSILDEIIAAKKLEFDALRGVFFPADITCHLLQLDGENAAFTSKLELVAGWYLEYSNFRGRFELFYAESETNFKEKLKLSSHVAVGGEVYSIDRGETVPPQGEEPFWRLACTRTGEPKFEPPE